MAAHGSRIQRPFGSTWRASRGGEGSVLERRREDSEVWDSEGWFRSHREAKRAMRDLAREHPAEEFRIRAGPPPT